MSANDRQVDGDHYKKHGETGEQHWDRQWRLYGPGYFVGCITKYVERYQDKNGIRDLEKAKHFLEKLIELEEAKKLGEIGAKVRNPVIQAALDACAQSYVFTAGDPACDATRDYVDQDRG